VEEDTVRALAESGELPGRRRGDEWRFARAAVLDWPAGSAQTQRLPCPRMARCFVTRALPGPALDRLGAGHEVTVWPEPEPPSREVLVRGARDAEGLLSLLTDRVDAELIDAAPHLKAIANYAVGTDNVDLAAATARGIPVGNTPDVLTETTADLAFALMLAAARRITEADAAVRAGDWLEWSPGAFLGHDLHHSVLGIVGMGRIGRAMARRAEGFSMTVVSSSRSSGVTLDELLERADFVSLHAPLTPSTTGLIGERELALMKPTAVLVNTARGGLVQTRALERALREGEIAAAALDVTDPEPLPADHPLLGAPNLVVAPHIGSASHRTREAMAGMAVDNLLAALAGERMPHCANPEVYE
jgi:glyoxylate reductase